MSSHISASSPSSSSSTFSFSSTLHISVTNNVPREQKNEIKRKRRNDEIGGEAEFDENYGDGNGGSKMKKRFKEKNDNEGNEEKHSGFNNTAILPVILGPETITSQLMREIIPIFSTEQLKKQAEIESKRLKLVHEMKKQYPFELEDNDFLYRLIVHSYRDVDDKKHVTVDNICEQYILGPKNDMCKSDPLQIEFSSHSARVRFESTSTTSPIITTDETIAEFTCCICLELIYDPACLPCGHSGCLECMKQAFTSNKSCPLCRQNVKVEPIVSEQLQRTIQKRFPKEYAARAPPPLVPLAHTISRQTVNDYLWQHYGLKPRGTKVDPTKLRWYVASDKRKKICDLLTFHSEALVARLLSDVAIRHPFGNSKTAVDRANLLTKILHDNDLPYYRKYEKFTQMSISLWSEVRNRYKALLTSNDTITQSTQELPFDPAFQRKLAEIVFQRNLTTIRSANVNFFLPDHQIRKLFRTAGVLFETTDAIVTARDACMTRLIASLMQTVKETIETTDNSTNININTNTLLSVIPKLAAQHKQLGNGRVYGFGTIGKNRYVLGNGIIAVLTSIYPSLQIADVALSVVHDMLTHTLIDLAMESFRIAKKETNSEKRPQAVKRIDGVFTHFEVLWNLECNQYQKRRLLPTFGVGSREIIREEHLIAAMEHVFHGQLLKHGRDEITMCLEKLKSVAEMTTKSKGDPETLKECLPSSLSSIVFPPELIYFLLEQNPMFPTNDEFVFTPSSLICLSVVMEYITAVILITAGNICINIEEATISANVVMESVRTNENLNQMFPGMFRFGRVVPQPRKDIPILNTIPTVIAWNGWKQQFCEYCKDAVDIVSPWSGEIVIVGKEYLPLGMVPAPIANAIVWINESGNTEEANIFHRQLTALQYLPKPLHDALYHFLQQPEVIVSQRIEEIYAAQRSSTLPIVDEVAMYLLCQREWKGCVSKIGEGAVEGTMMTMTAEACDMICLLVEHYMIALLREANGVAERDGRRYVTGKDIGECF